MENKKIKLIFVELAMCFLQVVYSKVFLFDFLSPVGLSFAFIRVLFGANILLVSFEYAISRIFLFFNLNSILITAYQIVILALFYFAKEFSKRSKNLLLLFLFLLLSNVLEFYFEMQSMERLWHFGANLVSQFLILIYFNFLFCACKKKFVFFKFSHIDYFLFSIFVFLTILGIFSYTYHVQFVEIFILATLLIIFSKVLPTEKYLVLSSLLALGSLFVSSNYFYIVFVVITAIVLVEIKDFNRFIFSGVCLILFTCIVLTFKLFDIFTIVSLGVSVLISLIVPEKWLNNFSQFFDMNGYFLIYKFLEQQKMKEVQSKLVLMSNTFLSMHKDFKFLLIGKIDREKACVELASDVINKCCSNCENFRSCFFENINKRAMFENLINKAISSKKIDEADMSNGLQAYCSKRGIVLNEINQIADNFTRFETAMKNEDSSKLLISDELKNFSDIFLNFSRLIESGVKPNERLSKLLKEKLMNNLIDAKEVVILEGESGIKSVNIIASNEQILKREMIEVIERTTKNIMKLKTASHTSVSGLSLATFIPVSKLRVAFAVSTKSREKRNGDNVIITKLSETKYFVALADGMGHGEKANKISSLVLSLIKSMFEVGLDDELIITSVNKLLIPAGLDNFTTLDALVVDLEKGECTFIKLGSSVSVLKRKQESEVVVSKSLPIGIVQNISPTITKKTIQAGDAIFLASDGVVDSFPSVENYKCFINDAKIFNMQKFLDDVITDAGAMTEHPDDMTLISINLLKNY